MTPGFKVASVQEVAGAPVSISRFSQMVKGEHRRFFNGLAVLAPEDKRSPLAPGISASVVEPDLAARWREYDEHYRAQARLSRFWVTDLAEATVFPPFGIVAVAGKLVSETIRHYPMLHSIFPDTHPDRLKEAVLSPAATIEAAAPPPVRRVPGHSFLLGPGVYANYFNWTLRYASRVAMFQAMPADCRLVAPSANRRFVNGTLTFMGVAQDRVEHLDGPVLFERLTLMSPFAKGRYEISPQLTLTLREHPRVRDLPRRAKRRLYIPRRNVRMRRVVNAPAVEEALKLLGFEVFDNGEYSVAEQVHAFRDASIIVAPHGAGLSNIVYCDPGTTVIELVPEGYDQGVTSYRSLADLFDLRYTQLFAREAVPDRKGNRCNADIEVDIAELTQTLGALLEHAAPSPGQ